MRCRYFILLDAIIPIRSVSYQTDLSTASDRTHAPSRRHCVWYLINDHLLSCSLYVTLELVKLIQCMYAAADRKMYDATSDTPFVYKTTTLNEVSVSRMLLQTRAYEASPYFCRCTLQACHGAVVCPRRILGRSSMCCPIRQVCFYLIFSS